MFDFVNNFYIVMVRDANGNNVSTNPDAVPESGGAYWLPAQTPRTYTNPHSQHFGLKMTIENVEYDSFKSAFNIKCWDSTGKDLGMTVKTNYNDVTISSLERPTAESVLTSFSRTDSLLFDRSAHMCESRILEDYRSATFSGYSSLINADADEIAGKGASDGVLRYELVSNTQMGIAAGSVWFGNPLTKEEIAAGGTLKLRLYCSAPETETLRLSLLPFTNTAVTFENDAPFIDLINEKGTGIAEAIRKSDKFIDVSLSAEQLAKLVDGQDALKGFTVFSQRKSGLENATVYFDKVVFSNAAQLSFYSEGGSLLESKGVSTGNTLKELEIAFPSTTGIGWTKTKGGTDFFTENTVIDGDLSLLVKTGSRARTRLWRACITTRLRAGISS